MLGISVMVETHPEFSQKYLEAARIQAKNSLTKEKGCLCFSVHTNKKDPNRFFLYEKYATKEDLVDIHSKTDYIAAYRELTEPWVKSKEIIVWEALPDEK
ncbi:antibiotic biosynthesis monooxygenase [Desulfovibrio sp. OttesenSCG-928-O18]|nr:antibiotic biosynthesis monooxygenase [Desulfovibrio sp. OttesenSCG-928-O18]